ncbi:hypothetical protein NECAME_09063 [Necator americanus]|uniref:Uncharacterized protein n=1 Tax=Necator americanus TaxID=51031 RepID=W2TF04_NECAM|nr:hypothetical protein NECAME_09063 [Necator americanus]ETN80640.1 hypothetical protein NECAME_09063 [Necator americanus]
MNRRKTKAVVCLMDRVRNKQHNWHFRKNPCPANDFSFANVSLTFNHAARTPTNPRIRQLPRKGSSWWRNLVMDDDKTRAPKAPPTAPEIIIGDNQA